MSIIRHSGSFLLHHELSDDYKGTGLSRALKQQRKLKLTDFFSNMTEAGSVQFFREAGGGGLGRT